MSDTPAPALGAQQLAAAIETLRADVATPCACGPMAVGRLLAAYDAQAARLAVVETERADLEQRLYRVLTHDGVAHGCCWDAMTTAVQSVVITTGTVMSDAQ